MSNVRRIKKQKLSTLTLSVMVAMSVPSLSFAQDHEVNIQSSNITPVENTENTSSSNTADNSAQIASATTATSSQNIHQQVQQILQQQPAIQKLQFDDLEQYQPNVDSAMYNEIYQIAEQAKKDAQVWQDTGKTTAQTIQHSLLDDAENLTINKLDVESLKPPVDVNDLVRTIQQDSVQVVNTVQQVEQNQQDIFHDLNIEQEEQKLSWFQRLKQKRNLPILKREKYVKVHVFNSDSKILEENIQAKLETLTVDSVKDFSLILPQLKKMANQAAQAVGYYDMDFAFSPSDDGKTVDVKIIKKVEPVRVTEPVEVEFTGDGSYLPAFQLVNVVPDLTKGSIFHHGEYELTKERVQEASTGNGFFDAYWKMRDVKVTLPENTADINLKYETGERYKFGDVEFRMSDASKPLPIDERILREMITWKTGDNYTAWRVNQFSNYLSNSRFFNSVSVNVVTPDPIEKTLDLPPDLVKLVEKQNVNVDAKPVQSVKNVDETQFAGHDGDTQTTTSNRSVALPTLTEADKALQAEQTEQQRLQQQARETKQIPVIVTLNADNPNSMELGLGYGTDTGARTRMQYRRAFLNRMGHSLQANLDVSKIRQAGEVRYYIPYHHPINRYFTLLGGYERESDFSLGNDLSLVTETAVAGLNFTIKNQRFDAWQHDFGLRYRLDRLTVNGDVNPLDIPKEFVIVQGQDTQQSLLASYKASKIYADSATNPTQGFRHHYKVELGSKNVLTDVDMAILSAGMGFIYSFGQNNNHQFVGRADGSYMFTNDFSKVPYNLRFFAGGDQSIRGFDYKSLSPTQNGLKIGGQILAVGSLEYNYQVVKDWRVAIFSDFGNSFDKQFDTPIAYSAGLGVRWQSPVGPIRIDIASGISDKNYPVRLHFFIGSPLQ